MFFACPMGLSCTYTLLTLSYTIKYLGLVTILRSTGRGGGGGLQNGRGGGDMCIRGGGGVLVMLKGRHKKF